MGRFLPRIAEPRTGRTPAVWHVVLTCCLFAIAPAGVLAQGAEATRTYWVPARSFNIPFNTDNDPRIVDVLLHVSTDNQPYRYVASARPSDRRFFYQAPGDGWYSFVVQTRDRDGVLTPANVTGAPPSIKVCVDSQRPVITVQPVAPQEGYPAAIQWSIQDANFDDIRADYRSVSGGEWYPLFLSRTASGRHDWTPAVPGDLEVRMQALDKAKNQAVPQSATVKPAPTPPGAPPPPAANAPSDIRHVKNKTFQLEYQLDEGTIGPSDVKSVDIWRMRQGGPWQKCREAGPPKGPATVTVETTGRWGFRLIPRSGVGLAEPDPRPGEPPDLWVEVDDRPPQVRVVNVVVTPGGDTGRMTVTWTASDPFLGRQPITIAYSPLDQEKWTVIDRSENTGTFTCEPAKLGLPYQFYLRVQAVDEAGNVGEDKWREPVKVDLKVPRIKRIEVRPGDGQQQTQAPPPPQGPYPPARPAAAPKPATNNNGLPGFQVP